MVHEEVGMQSQAEVCLAGYQGHLSADATAISGVNAHRTNIRLAKPQSVNQKTRHCVQLLIFNSW
jgi:hypothetical protein